MTRLLPLVAALSLASSLLAGTPAAAVVPSPMQPVPAGDSRFRYEGRFDQSNPAAPVVIWQGSRIAVDFEGTALAVRFEWIEGQNFFDATVDDTTAVIAVNSAAQSRVDFPQPLAPGRHRLTLFKRSEAAAGTARFRGIEIGDGAHAWQPAAPAYKFKLMFVGDSITAGACNEDGATDQWENRSTHNNARSYAAFTAATLGADYRNIAVSGMGVVVGWVEPRAGQIWDRVYPVPSSPRADLTTWIPEVICVNLGENDDSFSTANQRPFPVGFANAYVALIDAIRAAYPAAHIVLLRGGMYGGANSEPLREAWLAAVRKLSAKDPRFHHFVFTHWSTTHPRVSDARAMADELTAWLEKQDSLKPYR